MVENISCAILAGGSGSRLNGRVKPKIVIAGKTIIERQIAVLSGIFQEIIIVTNNPEEFSESFSCRIVGDEIPDAGPLGGIHAALRASSSGAVFIIAGDMPFPDRDIIGSLVTCFRAHDHDAIIPRNGSYSEPLHAVYRASLAGSLSDFLKTGKDLAVLDFIAQLDVQYLYLENPGKIVRAFTNINFPADITEAEKNASEG